MSPSGPIPARPKGLTVVGELLAKKGVEFEYAGENDEACPACKLRKVCHSLEVGRRYRIIEVRPVKHDVCAVFDGLVQVVGVESVPWEMHVPAARLRGTMVTRHFEECGFKACPMRALCAPTGIPEGRAVQVLRVGAKVDCPAGRDLRRVTVDKA